MGAILSLLWALLQTLAINAYSFAKHCAAIAWAWFTIKVPTLVGMLFSYRALLWATTGLCIAVIYAAITDAIQAAQVAVDAYLGMSSLITSSGWASWLIWDGPLQGSVLWDQLISVFNVWGTLKLASFGITRAEFFRAQALRGLSPK